MAHSFDPDPTDQAAIVPVAEPVTVWPVTPRRWFYPVAFVLALGAWIVVLAIVVGAAIKAQWDQIENAMPKSPANDIHLYQFGTEARYAVGTRAWLAGTPNSDQFYEQSKRLFAGGIDQRLRFVVLAGELGGPEDALRYLDVLDDLIAKHGTSYSPEQRLQRDTLRKLYRDYSHLRYDAPTVPEVERIQLREQLGWFGELALAPAGQPGAANTNFVAGAGLPAVNDARDECPAPALRQQLLQSAKLLAAFVWALAIGVVGLVFLGFIGLIGFAIMAFMKHLKHGFMTGKSPAGVYIETFALWMMSYAGLSFGMSYLGEVVPFGEYRLMASAVLELATLLVVFWPVLRGVPWKQVRQDIGWTRGRQPVLEPAVGLACWIMSLPLVVMGVIFMMVANLAVRYFVPGPGPDDLYSPVEPDHPIALVLVRGDWWMRLQILFLASVVAPIVEETMFRGVLYRHLRELTGGAKYLSILAAAILSSLIFAVIHPQGLMAVPVLMALAFGFVLAREWRGTLLPGMVGHGLNNGMVLVISILTLGG